MNRLLAAALPLCAALLPAQVERYELGLRLRAFERDLEQITDAARRDAAFVQMNTAVQAFFRLDTGAVAKAIDAADRALRGDPGTPASRFARCLVLSLDQRLIAKGTRELPFTITAAYRSDEEAEPPGDLQLVIEPLTANGAAQRWPLGELPFEARLQLADAPAGDHVLRWSITRGDTVLARREQGLSIVADLQTQLDRIDGAVAVAEAISPPTIESKTLPALHKMLRGMQRRRPEETVLPGERLLHEAVILATAPTEPFYTEQRTGSFWLRVPVGTRTASVRLFVPSAPREGKAPLVIAVHGAGGSENLFFDGYGDGKVVRLAAPRGWFVVAPRNELTGVDCAALATALAQRFPIDLGKVFLVGHSMGAMQVVANATRAPERFAAAAALGGGGSVRRSDALAALPFFVGVGSRDFALGQARALDRSLRAAGAASTLREYAGVEHLAIVQLALDDVFGFFERALTSPK
ncbi:MAG: prolyl oligopeptidase family serine peptidase [Planctomycetes bacterium]|nr:prolyl oligopeptidase family serine peptidase [Planctomycetota bacterium]